MYIKNSLFTLFLILFSFFKSVSSVLFCYLLEYNVFKIVPLHNYYALLFIVNCKKS